VLPQPEVALFRSYEPRTEPRTTVSKLARYLIPLAMFIVLLGFLAVGFGSSTRAKCHHPHRQTCAGVSTRASRPAESSGEVEDLRGQVWLLNVWASGALPYARAPVLVDFEVRNPAIYGLNYKDKREDAKAWLAKTVIPTAFRSWMPMVGLASTRCAVCRNVPDR
jgi:hypothetical protein